MLLRPGAARLAQSLHPCTALRPSFAVADMPLRAKVLGQKKALATQAEDADDANHPDNVLFHTSYGVRAIELNRPSKLNALSGDMAVKILERLREYEKSQLANIIIIKGRGDKSFCAGGDITALAKQNYPNGIMSESGVQKSAEYFKTEYTLDHLIATYSKPYVAFMDGATMGGGVGLSLHAPFRIATERTVFGMPETKIGFFTDVGGSFFLPRLDGQLGTYLGLTGETLRGVDTLFSGIATHYLDSTSLPSLEHRLSELQFPDSATLDEKYEIVDSTIEEFSTGLPTPHPLSPALQAPNRILIDECFSPPTLPDILSKLKSHLDDSKFVKKTHESLHERCPLSVLATLTLIRAGKHVGITTAFQHEALVAARFMRSRAFYLGVRHLLWEKRKSAPAWPGPSLREIASNTELTEKLLTEYVYVREGEDERLSLDRGTDYTKYPHWWVGLPSEEEIRKKVEGEWAKGKGMSREEVVGWFVDGRRGKEGVREKVSEALERLTMVEAEGGCRWIG